MPRRNSWNLSIDEVSGLGRRRDPASGRPELLAVGDRESTVVTLTADGSGRLPVAGDHGSAGVRHPVRGLPSELTGSRGQSDWEGVAGDADGRVFILQESGSRVLIVSPTFEFEGSVSLDWDRRDGTSLESLLLLADGHFLSATRRRRCASSSSPLQEPAPPTSAGGRRSRRIDPCNSRREPTCAARGRGRSATDRVTSVNDLALFGQHLFVISSRSRSIARFRLPPAGSRRSRTGRRVAPARPHRRRSRRPGGGVLIDAQLGVLVGVDRRPGAPGPNLHELDRDALETQP